MFRCCLAVLGFSLASVAAAASIAGSGFTAVYSLARNGVELGQVTDVLKLTGDHYSLVSESRATGPLKLLVSGVIHLESQGMISNSTLAPLLYRRIRSDNAKKSEKVEFDWKSKRVTLTHNGQARQEPLSEGTQDNLSQAYSFLFLPSLPEKLVVPIATGKNVNVYRYNQYPSQAIVTSAGKFDVVEYRRDASSGEKEVSVWISRDLPHLPVQVRVVDDGVRVEQKLTRITPGG